MDTIKLSVTVKSRLEKKYDAATLKKINTAIKDWVAQDKQRGIRTVHVALDDAKAMNFAGLCCLVRGSVIAGAPRAIRKRRRLSKMVDELGGRIRPCTHEHAHPSRRCSGFLCEHLRWNLPFAISRLSLSTLRYRILRHPVDPALGARSHPSCRYWSRRSCNILL